MSAVLLETHGNPSSLHAAGRAARDVVEKARKSVAALVGALPEEIVFTSGGTEADQLAVRGAARAARAKGRGAHVVTSTIEHPAIVGACEALREDGFEITVVPVGEGGIGARDGAARESRDRFGAAHRRAGGYGRAHAHRRGSGRRQDSDRCRRAGRVVAFAVGAQD